MKRFYLFLFASLFSLWSFSQTSKTVTNAVAGTLGTEFTETDYSSVTHLTISGNLNAYDFVFIRKFTLLEHLDLLNVNIERHEGEVYHVANYNDYPANEFPHAGLQNSPVKSVVFPASITSIGMEAFANSKLQGRLIIPSGITHIKSAAFGACRNITSVVFPSSLEYIGTSAFSDCSGITEAVSFPAGLNTIGAGAFSYCTQLPAIGSFPGVLTTIKADAFRGCTALTGHVTIPTTLVSVGTYVFASSGISAATVEKDSVPYGIFNECKNLLQVQLNNTKVIMNEAFTGCSRMTEITFPATLKSIEDYAFTNSVLTGNLVLPEGLKKIGNGAFENSIFLTSVTFPSTLTEISERAFMSCNGLNQALNLPDQISKIGMSAFYGCSKLPEIKLPDNNTLIETQAFANCAAVVKITLPQQLTAIGDYVFQDCHAVYEIYAFNTTPPVLGTDALSGISRTGCKIYVPDASIGIYRAAPQWSEFGEQIVSNIAPDTQAPVLLYGYPGNNTGVSRKPSCILQFDEFVRLTDNFSVNIVRKSNQEIVYMYGTGNRVNTDSNMVYMEPMKNVFLESNTEYEVKIGAGSIADRKNNLFPATNTSYSFTTGNGSPSVVLDFNQSDYERESTEYLGFQKSTIYCFADLVSGNQFFNHRFFSKDNFVEKHIGFSINKFTDECLLNTPSSHSPNPYVSTDNTSLVLNQGSENSLYPASHTNALIDLSVFPAGYKVSDVVARVSATSPDGSYNQMELKAYFAGGAERAILLNGTADAGYFDYESDTYGNKYYYREIHFPVSGDEKIDSIVIKRNNFVLIKIMKVDVYYKITAKPVVNLGPDRNVCSFDDEYLDAGYLPGATYLWSTGEITQKIKIGGTANYWVDVKNMLGSSRDTVHITSYPRPLKAFKDSVIYKCAQEPVTLSAIENPNFTYLWNTGATTRSITVTEAGLYTCVVTNFVCSIIDSVGVVNTTKTLGFRYMPCCVAGYDDVQGELFKKNENNRYELYDSKIMYGEMAFFNDMPDGEYIFKAHFLKYSNGAINPWLDTYHDGSTMWQGIVPLKVDCNTDTTINFNLATEPSGFVFNGNGRIAGNVIIQGLSGAPQKISSVFNSSNAGVRVLLLDANHALIATATTDSDGYYTFTNLPAGTYNIIIERTGYSMTESVTVQIPVEASFTGIDFTVDVVNMIVIPGVRVGVDEYSVLQLQVSVYPNPVREQTVIKISSPAAIDANMQITDMTGRVVKEEVYSLWQGENKFTYTNPGLKGIFFLKLSSEQFSHTARLIFE